MKFISIGYNNSIAIEKIVAVVSPDASPIKRIRQSAKEANKLIDATNGRKTRSVVITDSDHIILSGLAPETIVQRMQK